MLITLDYDQTYTACPALWHAFLRSAEDLGIDVICVTRRHANEVPLMRVPLPPGLCLITTGRAPKGAYLLSLGLNPDIWIDDDPASIYGPAVTPPALEAGSYRSKTDGDL